MNKLTTTLWIVIIVGIVFVGIQMFKPETSTKNGQNSSKTSTSTETSTESEQIEIENISPGNYTHYLSEGDKLSAAGQLSSAIKNYEAAVQLNPKSTSTLLKLAEAYLKNSNPVSAEKTFQKAIKLSPSSLEAQLGLARSYLNQRNIEKAKTIVWTLDKSSPYVQYYTGIILILYKDFEGAKKIFASLIPTEKETEETQPKIPTSISEKSAKFIKAYTLFDQFKDGEQIFLETLLAKALTETEEFEASIPLLYDVINQKNNYRDAWIVLGYAYLKSNKSLDAIDAFSQAKKLDEEKPETLFYLGLSYFANDDLDKAIFYLEKAEKAGYEPQAQVKLKLGDLYSLKEQYGDSSEKYEEVISLNPTNLDVFVRAIWLNIEKLNDPSKALKLAQTALQTHPEDAMSFNLVGWALTAGQNYAEAKKYLAKAMQLKPNFDAAHLNLGWLYEKLGQLNTAKEYYKKAYALGLGNSISALAAQRYNNIQETLKASVLHTN